MIGLENVPQDLKVNQVIGDEWIFPNDPRLAFIPQPGTGK
jgi:hypothetical protein